MDSGKTSQRNGSACLVTVRALSIEFAAQLVFTVKGHKKTLSMYTCIISFVYLCFVTSYINMTEYLLCLEMEMFAHICSPSEKTNIMLVIVEHHG